MTQYQGNVTCVCMHGCVFVCKLALYDLRRTDIKVLLHMCTQACVCVCELALYDLPRSDIKVTFHICMCICACASWLCMTCVQVNQGTTTCVCVYVCVCVSPLSMTYVEAMSRYVYFAFIYRKRNAHPWPKEEVCAACACVRVARTYMYL